MLEKDYSQATGESLCPSYYYKSKMEIVTEISEVLSYSEAEEC